MLPSILILTQNVYSSSVPRLSLIVEILCEEFERVLEDTVVNRSVEIRDEFRVIGCCGYPTSAAVLLFNHEGAAIRTWCKGKDGVAVLVLSRGEVAPPSVVIKVRDLVLSSLIGHGHPN